MATAESGSDAPLVLGIDVGTSRTKAVLLDPLGGTVASESVATPFAVVDDRVEMDVRSLQRSLGSVLLALGDDRRRVVAAGVAGMAESGAPLDGAGRPLAPIVAWHDPRGAHAVKTLSDRFGDDLPLRIGQEIRTVLTVAKLGWLVEHGLERIVRWLGVPELVLHTLTGEEATEFSLAARTGCFDIAGRAWIPEVAIALGFTVDVFPVIVAAGATVGTVSPAGAAWTGLPAGIPVTIAGHDHLAGMAGAGVGRRDAGNSVGTAETVVACSDTLPDVSRALAERARVTLHPGGDAWAVLVGAARAGLVLEGAAVALGRSPRALDRMAAEAHPADIGDAVDVLARGGQAVLPDAPAREVWAALLAALTARTVDAYARLVNVVGPRQQLVVFGGGAVSEPWLRAKTAAMPIPVVRSVVGSPIARGAALYAGVTAGWWPSPRHAPLPPSDSGPA